MSIFAPALSSLWRQIEDYGFDPEPMFRKFGIDPGLRFDPNARVSYTKTDQIMAEAARRVADPVFGLKEANYFIPAHIGPLGFAWLASTNLQTAMIRLQRYIRVIHEKIQIEIHDEPGAWVVSVIMNSPSANAYHRDSGYLAVLTAMCRFVYGDNWNPLLVRLAHPPPRDTSYFFSFFRCQVEFGSPVNSLHIDPDQAIERLSGSNRQLAQLNDHIVVKYLAGQDRNDIINRVKTAILETLGEGCISESSVAQCLHMSSRNLSRKLVSEGTSFKNLLLEIRTELANQYISDASMTLTEISYLLGFSEISSFSRAYRRWTGLSPSEARKARSAGNS